MCPPPNQVKCKGAPNDWSKRPRYSQEERSTKRSPSLVEHVESQCSYAGQKSGRKTSQTLKCSWPNLNHLPLHAPVL
jgi:hypothetical protein